MRASRLIISRSLSSKREFSSSTLRRAINKICSSAQEAIKDMKGGTTVLVGGFGFSGVPNSLINALRDRPDLKDFTVVSNNAGMPGVGLGGYFQLPEVKKNRTNKLAQGSYWKLSRSAR
jgi:3-oxoacid CoA-transferase